ncbi:gibberellin 2-oxidase 8, ARABIDOPSIS THALIANA GIBBERELLIN 2-OXIDASE 8 [Hibiscus trionum]|uniref:Gibberellin 2-oxidase 8, ARABIDOPSIS THALIANA GIBBERELLIN 2-OXIDASE 8 n=1 Tax=Hibiscus trionum TaxID=183268 RepID=A0A9W7MUY0_HIBTR|nr:gibberellin 2-oxidase 8, ARABIDOPSIS THALIANA GIBBERELLIN 2-OXIDASE 8 [Hibiscus trionum]
MATEPPFFEKYKAIFQSSANEKEESAMVDVFEELELPLVDIGHLNLGPFERQECIETMARAATEWGFFQIVNHGIPEELLNRLEHEQVKVFQQPFDNKSEENFLNLSVQSYRWGNPLATSLRTLSWSEALHISIKDISEMDEYNNLRSTIEEYAEKVNVLAQRLAEHLAQNLGIRASYFRDNCSPSSSSLRMNRYPSCPYSSMMFGIIPHTDTDFLTIVSQDQVGGLQLKRDGRWVSVKPNPKALVVNIGDFYQALSNGKYKSITHRVIANQESERYSAAYFYCPTYETVIESCSRPSLYRKFSFKEYREQIQKDVKATGGKVGISQFLL